MPRVRGEKDYLSLAQGLITEASPLAFPEGATTDELNFLLDFNGVVRFRRKGFENLVQSFPVAKDASQTVQFDNILYWETPDLLLLTFKISGPNPRTELQIHRNDSSFTKVGTFEIAQEAVTSEIAETTDFLCITTSASQKPVLVEYIQEVPELRIYEVDLYIRDFILVEDDLTLTERPTVLDDNHNYNLLNAGWYAERKLESAGGLKGSPLSDFFLTEGEYPSNADIPLLGVKANADGEEVFSADTLNEVVIGNSEAPRGHYVYNIDNFDRTPKLSNPQDDGAPDTTTTLLTSIPL